MYIIGMIFKIIGILLLLLLGIILVLLLSVLFVPLRYKFKWEKEEETPHCVHVGLSWWLHIVALSVEYQEQFSYVIRVFGIPIKKGTFQQEETEQEEESFDSFSDDFVSEETFDKKADFQKKDKEKTKSSSDLEKKKTEEKIVFPEENEQKITKDSVSMDAEKEMFSSKKNKTPEKENTKKESIDIEGDAQEFEVALPSTRKKKTPIWKKWLEKVKRFVAFLKRIPEFFKSLFYKAKDLWQNVGDKKSHVMEKIHMVLDFWQAEENQGGKRLIFAKGKNIVKHILPKKCKGYIRFGLSNPAATGQVLAVISIVGGLAGVMPNIEPDFSKETLEGKFYCRGRLQIGYLLWQGLRLWFHEDMKRVKENFNKVRRAF